MLKISHLQKHYRGFSLDCSMEVQPGMITGLIGRNGSGKSTTFKALLGLIYPDGGEIEVDRKSTRRSSDLLGKRQKILSRRISRNWELFLQIQASVCI